MDTLTEVQIERSAKETTFIFSEQEQNGVIASLKKNSSVFDWSVDQMRGIDPKVACHELDIDPKMKPRQIKTKAIGL